MKPLAYVIENSFQKLSLLKSCGANPMQELKAVIVADDTAQLNMHLGGPGSEQQCQARN